MESNKFPQEKLTNWQRLECVIKWANMTTNYFARYIGLARGENLYQIKRGNNGISLKIAEMITEKFPQINMLWLLTGSGDMLSAEATGAATKPFYNVGVEQNLHQIDSIEPEQQMILPTSIDCDFGIVYHGQAMGAVTPTNTVLLLKKILPEMIIPGNECVIVTKKIVLLRIVKFEEGDLGGRSLRLTAKNSEFFGDMVVALSDVEAVYVVKGKVLINN